jgi:hypothetical protein
VKKPKPGDRVEVRWLDAYSYSGWTDREEAIARASKESFEVVSLGFLLEETDDWVLVAMGDMGGNLVHDPLQIPRSIVLSLKAVRAA